MSRLALLRHPVHAFSLGGGLGLLPWAPGTFGTVPGFALALALRAGLPTTVARWSVLLLLLLLGAWCAGQTAIALRSKDPGSVVCDEFLAFAGLLLLVPCEPWTWAWAFLCFRLFDVTKPFPVGWADRRLPGGLGIMCDDLLAAAWAWLLLQGLALCALPGGPLR